MGSQAWEKVLGFEAAAGSRGQDGFLRLAVLNWLQYCVSGGINNQLTSTDSWSQPLCQNKVQCNARLEPITMCLLVPAKF